MAVTSGGSLAESVRLFLIDKGHERPIQTWGDFKTAVQSMGIKDDFLLSSVPIGLMAVTTKQLPTVKTYIKPKSKKPKR